MNKNLRSISYVLRYGYKGWVIDYEDIGLSHRRIYKGTKEGCPDQRGFSWNALKSKINHFENELNQV
ncbi:hypothetical protein MY04_4776 [Flammeovirga sp. MY04]|uniref:hypothetical protein n=1 Tax=Flammeovirga sp. MY04 TaxID=1191459 RepID=UPI0008062889|nr:hypothetical protein [Flammeovirga sp. MY04]ANQ49593.1 hypothetical protein MY04_2219 [Flammeovirga sp. MY04]ANQ52111.1 hypothetical protein MY04_4776 [Flammeovirga sp. MY04]